MELTKHLLFQHWRDQGQDAPIALFGQLKRIVRQWLDECLNARGGTYPAQLMYRELADMACQRITKGITAKELQKGRQVKAILDPFNPTGSTAHVRFNTSRPGSERWETLGGKISQRTRSTGSSWTVAGKANSAASPSRTPRCWPTPRTTTSA